MMFFNYLILIIFCFKLNKCSLDINVGAIFDDDDINTEIAFRLAIDNINKQLVNNYHLIPLPKHIDQNNALYAVQAVCELMSEGVVVILGPSSEENADAVQSVCDAKDVSYIETRWNSRQQRGNGLNIYPYPSVLAFAYLDVLKIWKWKSFTILYEDYDGLARVSELLKLYDNKGHTVVLKQLDRNKTGNYRPILKEVWKSGQKHIVLDCSIDHLEDILQQAQQIGLMTSVYEFIITNLDMHTINLEPYQYGETKITGFKIIEPEDAEIIEITEKLEAIRKENNQEYEDFPNVAAWKIRLETALTIDAITVFAYAFNELEITDNFDVKTLDCNSTENWQHGYSINNFMKTNPIKGLTGSIKFDHQGFRSDFTVDVIELREGGIVKVTDWSSTEGLNKSKPYPKPEFELSLRNVSFIVITALTDPYGMWKESQAKLYGNDRFEGFGIDLIHELSLLIGFNYTFILRHDKKNGEKLPNGSWSGMIGDVNDFTADLAITDLTITSGREQAVDFTSPFMNLGISILYKKPTKAPPNFFSFAEPFAIEVWLMLGAAYFGVSISLFVMGRLCPSEWNNPFPCIEEPDFLINQFSLRNSFWFTIGSLMQQGTEIAPIAIATRMVAGLWWFFTLIMVSSYTANLAAFLTTETPDSPFTNVKELADRAEYAGIKVGAKKGGATANFFKESNVTEYMKIYKLMQKYEDEVMVGDNKDGVKKAEDEKYAFFMESVSIEYETQRHCDLTKIGGELDEKSYGIAMRKNFKYRTILSAGVLKLQESGKIADLKRKWWESRRGGGQCSSDSDSQEAKPLNLKNVGGVFWVSFGGIMLACAFVFIEMLLHVAKESLKTGAPFALELKEEIKFFFKFKGMVKPVRNRKSNSKSKSPEQKSLENSYGFITDSVRKQLTNNQCEN